MQYHYYFNIDSIGSILSNARISEKDRINRPPGYFATLSMFQRLLSGGESQGTNSPIQFPRANLDKSYRGKYTIINICWQVNAMQSYCKDHCRFQKTVDSGNREVLRFPPLIKRRTDLTYLIDYT